MNHEILVEGFINGLPTVETRDGGEPIFFRQLRLQESLELALDRGALRGDCQPAGTHGGGKQGGATMRRRLFYQQIDSLDNPSTVGGARCRDAGSC